MIALRRVSLMARLEALNVAADEARRYETATDRQVAAQDHLAALRDSAMTDPVTGRIVRVVGAPTSSIDLIIALAFGLLLESVGCISWLLALPQPDATPRVATTNGSARIAVAIGDAPVASRAGTMQFASTRPTPDSVPGITSNWLPAASNEAQKSSVPLNAMGAMTDARVAASRSWALVTEIRRHFRQAGTEAHGPGTHFAILSRESERSG